MTASLLVEMTTGPPLVVVESLLPHGPLPAQDEMTASLLMESLWPGPEHCPPQLPCRVALPHPPQVKARASLGRVALPHPRATDMRRPLQQQQQQQQWPALLLPALSSCRGRAAGQPPALPTTRGRPGQRPQIPQWRPRRGGAGPGGGAPATDGCGPESVNTECGCCGSRGRCKKIMSAALAAHDAWNFSSSSFPHTPHT